MNSVPCSAKHSPRLGVGRAVGSSPRTFTVSVVGHAPAIACRADRSLLASITACRRGVVNSGCHGGGCGVCRIVVREGRYNASGMSRAHVSAADEVAGIALACRTWPLSNMTIEPLGKLVARRHDQLFTNSLQPSGASK